MKVLRWFRSRGILFAGIAVCLALVVLFRGHWLISANSLEPDEAQLLAAGKEAARNLIPYRTYTTYTYLFLWPMFLGLVHLVGVPLQFATAHIIAALFLVLFIVTGWHLIAKERGWLLSTVIVLPPAIYLFNGAGNQFDLLALGTETLPIAILSVALLVLFLPNSDLTRRRFLIASAICGVAPWAKPQLAPLAVALVVSCALIRTLESTVGAADSLQALTMRSLGRDLATGLLAFAAPTLAAVLFLVVTGEFSAFVSFGLAGTSGIFSYVHSSNTAAVSLMGRVQTLASFLIRFGIAFMWAAGGLIGWRFIRGPHRGALEAVRAICWALPLFAAIATLLVLQQLYPHYINILFAAAMMSGILGARLARVSGQAGRRWSPRVGVFTVASGLITALLVINYFGQLGHNVTFAKSEVVAIVTSNAGLTTDNYDAIGSNVPENCPEGSSVFVYGYSNELYSYYSWQPATQALVENWGLSHEKAALPIVRVLLAELKAAPPRCIIDTTGPYFFGGIPTSDTIQRIVPGISVLLRTCYRRYESPVGMASYGYTGEEGQTVKYWVRRDRCTTSDPGTASSRSS